MKFYLGTHRPHWLEFSEIPLFISYRTLRLKKNLKPSTCSWALDSGGFSELSLYGKWTISPKEYAMNVRRYENEIGNLDFAAIQDYMCEPFILEKTGLSISQHQYLTCASYLTLKNFNPDTNWLPVLQGWCLDDYLRHMDLYNKFNINLSKFKSVGVGSVCRRQSTNEIFEVMKSLKESKINIHGFGVKTDGIKKYKKYLKSSDSLAWSYGARYAPSLENCSHNSCANCFKYASLYYKKILAI